MAVPFGLELVRRDMQECVGKAFRYIVMENVRIHTPAVIFWDLVENFEQHFSYTFERVWIFGTRRISEYIRERCG
jgi:hypothetical protein